MISGLCTYKINNDLSFFSEVKVQAFKQIVQAILVYNLLPATLATLVVGITVYT